MMVKTIKQVEFVSNFTEGMKRREIFLNQKD
jgi:hypothetical protein